MIALEADKMNLILQLNSEIEARLKAHAAMAGKRPEEFALDAVRERLADVAASPPLTADEWQQQFDAWISAHHSRNLRLDDSRESIYADRD